MFLCYLYYTYANFCIFCTGYRYCRHIIHCQLTFNFRRNIVNSVHWVRHKYHQNTDIIHQQIYGSPNKLHVTLAIVHASEVALVTIVLWVWQSITHTNEHNTHADNAFRFVLSCIEANRWCAKNGDAKKNEKRKQQQQQTIATQICVIYTFI